MTSGDMLTKHHLHICSVANQVKNFHEDMTFQEKEGSVGHREAVLSAQTCGVGLWDALADKG